MNFYSSSKPSRLWSLAILFMSMTLLHCGICFGQSDLKSHASKELSLEDLSQLVLQNNLQIKSFKSNASASEFAIAPAQALDNPSVGITQDPMKGSPLSFGTSRGMVWSITQPIAWPGKKRLSGEILQTQAEINHEQVHLLSVQLLGQLKSNWLNWYQTQSQIKTNQILLDRLEQVKQISKIRYANNAAFYIDFINTQVSQAQLASDNLVLELQANNYLSQIKSLISLPAHEALNLKLEQPQVGDTAQTLAHYQNLALLHNPALKASRLSIVANAKSLELAQLGKRPDFSVSVNSTSASPPWGFAQTESYGMSINATFPLYFESKEKNLISLSALQLQSAKEADENLKTQVLYSVEQAYLQWQQSLEQLKLIQERILEQTKVAFRLTLSNYSTGQANYIDLSNAYNQLKGAELSVLQAQTAALQAKLNLDTTIGQQPQ
jgi:outer membrane protein, heavy metal efflux system